MIVNSAPENIAVVSNVNSISEFKIKSNYRSFQILSSGLYANKIRAIIRELGCNAKDSHVAAGKGDVAFDLHLPTYLEPYFAIRDYGTGLTHDQVVNIYTTYFESTKTNSNDFIGALGLGSKSPFSYTDNFTVTAICNGIKGIYTAFVNEHGVPSVALMADSQTDEPNGVEVKFAVDSKDDFNKFRNEAQTVFTYFPVKPNMVGASCAVKTVKYSEVDVIPGINVLNEEYNRYNDSSTSIAVMGCIAYPIAVPNEESNLGTLASHLRKNLEISFDIGDLEFQASREGLQYTKQTIEAIKNKLQLLQDKLDNILFTSADAIVNLWERAEFLISKYRIPLWINSVTNYIKTRNLKGLVSVNSYNAYFEDAQFNQQEIEDKYNIKLSGFLHNNYTIKKLKSQPVHNHTTRVYEQMWSIHVDKSTKFVKYSKFRGGYEHVKYHFENNFPKNGESVYIISPAKSDVPVKYDEFFAELYNPPLKNILDGDTFEAKPRETRVKSEHTITAMKLVTASQKNSKSMFTWKPIGNVANYDSTDTYYYIPLNGYSPIAMDGYPLSDVKDLFATIRDCGIQELSGIETIYGIRKADQSVVETMPNWVNIQQHIINTINNVNVDSFIGGYARNHLPNNVFSRYKSLSPLVSVNSEYHKFMKRCIENDKKLSAYSLDALCKVYAGGKVNSALYISKLKAEVDNFKKMYPLLGHINYDANEKHIAQYINMIDLSTTQTI